MSAQGRFITLEGIDGSGKSTQGRMLAERLKADGFDVLLTREPGGSPGAEEIRALVLEGDPDRWSAETELLLFTAARRDHLERTIRPALSAGKVVICDRFVDSTRMYQGGLSRGDLRGKVDALHDLMIGIEADLTLLFDMDPDIGHSRAKRAKRRKSGLKISAPGCRRRCGRGFLISPKSSPGGFVSSTQAGRLMPWPSMSCTSCGSIWDE